MRHGQRNVMPRWQRGLLFAGFAWLAVTGGLWLAVHFLGWPAIARATMAGLPSPWEHPLMQLHGLGVFLMLFMAGRVSVLHVKRGWRLRRHRFSGVVMVSALALLALSGYALFYLVPDDWRDPFGLVHTVVGFVCVAALCWHRRRAVR
ncbi:MAG: hypothetical protein QM749_17050 [Aquabacterium sp.]